jgi:hypothetical protein
VKTTNLQLADDKGEEAGAAKQDGLIDYSDLKNMP